MIDNTPKTFEEFTQAMTRDLHDALLKGGSKEMTGQLYIWLPYFSEWSSEQRKVK